jgi:hypothetical protein
MHEATLTLHDRDADGGRYIRWICGALLALTGVIDAWGSRFDINPDGVSYIDMARHAVAGAPDGLINGYWSPGYPMLLAPLTALGGSNPVTAIPLLHLVNFVLFLMAGWLFVQLATPTTPMWRIALPFAVAAFLHVTITGFGLGLVTPDMGIMLVVLMTVAACRQLERSEQSWRWAVVLGVLLAAGYWLKGIMLPLNAALLLGLVILPPNTVRARAKIGVASVVFALLCLPLIAMVSARVGRITMGEVGRLNYAWEIDGVTPFVGWAGDSTGRFGTPVHPPAVVTAEPRTLEFARPFSATYPLWFDASYWYAGLKPHFDAAGQWRVLRQGLHDLASLAHQLWLIPVSMLVLWLTSRKIPGTRAISRLDLVLLGWSVVAALLYAMVHVEPRYVAGFVCIAFLTLWRPIASRTPRRITPIVLMLATIALMVMTAMQIGASSGGYQRDYRPDYITQAERLHQFGVGEGDHVAMVGDAFEAFGAFAAHASITAQVMDSAGFWATTPARRSELQSQLAATGIKVLMANNVADAMTAEGWVLVPRAEGGNLGILPLKHAEK